MSLRAPIDRKGNGSRASGSLKGGCGGDAAALRKRKGRLSADRLSGDEWGLTRRLMLGAAGENTPLMRPLDLPHAAQGVARPRFGEH